MTRIADDIKLDFDDVLIEPQRSELFSRKEVNIERTFTFKHTKETWTGVPIISANMDTTGTFELAKIFAEYKMLTAVHKHYSVSEWEDFIKNNPSILNHVMVSTGVSENDFQKVKDIMKITNDIKFICIDIANGYSRILEKFVSKVRKEFPEKIIVAGNVVSKNMAEVLHESGADIVKVGIGPGSVCTTRIITGVGMPQLSAIIDCADASHGLKGHIIGDGGCKTAGDVSKAFCGGADFVMLGGIFAGHEESEGEIVTIEGKKFKKYYGMSSSTAMKKHSGGVKNYRASEGKEVLIPLKGSIHKTIQQILGGVRSTCTYIGAEKIKEMPKRASFIRVNRIVNTVYGQSDGLNL
tara:strand:- start:88648 stop:89706 length:1059 start_codon:yes stop_codon:yes gene_type:complete